MLTHSPECPCRLIAILNQISLAGFRLVAKYYYCKRSCSELSWQRFRRDPSVFVGWRRILLHGKHCWCLVSDLLKKYCCQCQLKSLSMQKLTSVPVADRDGKLRHELFNKRVNIDPPFNKMARSCDGNPVLWVSEASLLPVGASAASNQIPSGSEGLISENCSSSLQILYHISTLQHRIQQERRTPMKCISSHRQIH